MGLAAFVFFVVPWMVLAVWLFRLPGALRLGTPATPWRPLTDHPGPRRDRRPAVDPSSIGAAPAGGDAHGRRVDP